MNQSLLLLLSNLTALACVIAAAVLAVKSIAGWGWFLFVGLLMASSSSNSSMTPPPPLPEVQP